MRHYLSWTCWDIVTQVPLKCSCTWVVCQKWSPSITSPTKSLFSIIQKCYLEFRNVKLMTFIHPPPSPTCSFYHTFCTSSAQAVNQEQFSSYLEEIVSGKSGDHRADISCANFKCQVWRVNNVQWRVILSTLKFNFKGPVYCTVDMSVPYLVRYLPRWNCRWTKFPDADIFGISSIY